MAREIGSLIDNIHRVRRTAHDKHGARKSMKDTSSRVGPSLIPCRTTSHGKKEKRKARALRVQRATSANLGKPSSSPSHQPINVMNYDANSENDKKTDLLWW